MGSGGDTVTMLQIKVTITQRDNHKLSDLNYYLNQFDISSGAFWYVIIRIMMQTTLFYDRLTYNSVDTLFFTDPNDGVKH